MNTLTTQLKIMLQKIFASIVNDDQHCNDDTQRLSMPDLCGFDEVWADSVPKWHVDLHAGEIWFWCSKPVTFSPRVIYRPQLVSMAATAISEFNVRVTHRFTINNPVDFEDAVLFATEQTKQNLAVLLAIGLVPSQSVLELSNELEILDEDIARVRFKIMDKFNVYFHFH